MAPEIEGNLPTNWVWIELEEVIERISNGICQDNKANGVPVTRIETIADGRIDWKRIGYLSNPSGEQIEKYRLLKGDILFSHINSDAHIGKTALFEDDRLMIHGINLLLIRPRTHLIDSNYLHFLFSYYRSRGYFSQIAQHAVNQASINQAKMKTIRIPLPPLAEQRRIVVRMEELFKVSNQVAIHIDSVVQSKERLLAAILNKAFQGMIPHPSAQACSASQLLSSIHEKRLLLSKPRRLGDAEPPLDATHLPRIPKNWSWARLSELVHPGQPNYGIVKPNLDEPGDKTVPYICPDNLTDDGHIILEGVRCTSEGVSRSYSRTIIAERDILVTVRGTVGRVAEAAPAIIGANMSRGVAKVSPMEGINSSYLAMALRTPFSQRWMREKVRGIALQQINLGDLAMLPIPLAPIDEQNHIASTMLAAEKLIREASGSLSSAQHIHSMLNRSVYQLAFSGKLVSQDPNDEPASVQLERIKAERPKSKRANAS